MRSMRFAIKAGIAPLFLFGFLASPSRLFAFPGGAELPAAHSRHANTGDKEVKEKVDSIVKESMANHRIPSFVVAVVQNGKTVFQKAYGHDPLYTFAENAPSNTYALGPASQVLTGGAILLLVGEGKVGLDDPVSKYLSGIPEAWRLITIAQLLSHRSGLPAFPKDAKTFAAAAEAAARQPLRFKPGSQRAENPADFDLLGQVIEKVTGESYLRYMDRTVFKEMKFGDTGDVSQLLFRFVAPQDNRFETTSSTLGDMRVGGEENATAMSGRGYDPVTKGRMVEMLSRGMPDYSIPSRGLASNVPDLLKLSSAIFVPASTHIFNSPDYLTLAPGWKACDTGQDILLTTAGLFGEGYGVNLSLVPSRKTALILEWKMEKGSDATTLRDESQDILESALGLPVSTWICTSQEEEGDDEP
jgi:CubicO group peptidase (beta-lactamase class C family)